VPDGTRRRLAHAEHTAGSRRAIGAIAVTAAPPDPSGLTALKATRDNGASARK